MNVVPLIRELTLPGSSKRRLMDAVQHENESVRGTAVQLLAERYAGDPEVVVLIAEAAKDPRNRRPAMGTASVGHLCVKLLLQMRTTNAISAAEGLIGSWPETDRQNLDWFLSHG